MSATLAERHLLAAGRRQQRAARSRSGSPRTSSGKRTTTSKRRGPSRISVAVAPPIAVSTSSRTSRDVEAVARDPGRGRRRSRTCAAPGEHLDLQVGGAAHLVEHAPGSRSPSRSSVGGVGPEHLHRDVGLHARDHLVEAHGHRLGEVARRRPASSASASAMRVDQLLLGPAARPLVDRVQVHVDVALVDAHRLGGEVGPADLGDDLLHLGEAPEDLLDARRDGRPTPRARPTGSLRVSIRIEPSSRLGMNSVPMNGSEADGHGHHRERHRRASAAGGSSRPRGGAT